MSIFSFFKRKPQFQYDPSKVSEEESVIESNTFSSVKLNDLDFVDSSNSIFATVPIKLAKEIQVSSREFVEKQGKKFIFPLCPGMWDFARMGYILPAWTDFHIKSNKAGVAIIVGGAGRSTPFSNPYPMDTEIAKGIVKFSGVPDNVFNFASPWRIFSNTKNISCLILPAWYHMNPKILEHLYFYPGVVDYDKFRTINPIVSVIDKCQLTIPAGEPLLHIIPFINDKIICGYGPPTPEQEGEMNYNPVVHTNHFYRKKQQIKKEYALEEIKESENKE